MNLGTIILIFLVLVLFGVLPVWPYAQPWGWGPPGALGVAVIILLVLLLTGRL